MASDASESPASAAYERLDPRIQQFLWQEGWTELRSAQEHAIKPILDCDSDVIIAAATASGKTEAAFLPALTRLLQSATPRLIVYVSPLKALINDQFGRLTRLCETLDVPVWPWHGDIGASTKQRFWRNPTGVLLITPESVEAMFCNRGGAMGAALSRTDVVVVDELHAFIGTERGKQLQSLLHRMELLAMRRLMRIGLSATLGDMRLAADFLRPGQGDAVYLIEDRSQHSELRVLVKGYAEPVVRRERDADGNSVPTNPIAPAAIARDIFRVTRGSNNLVFPNSRREVERYTHLLNSLCEEGGIGKEYWPHHGSLAREIRADTEFALKNRESMAAAATAICTNTLELGIDIGAVKSVAQIGPAPTVASLRQRLGRSGRRKGEPAILRGYVDEGAVHAKSGLGQRLRLRTVHLIAEIELLLEGWCEPPALQGLHLSTMIQQLLSVCVQQGGVQAADAYQLLCGASATSTAPFAAVTRVEFTRLLRALGASDVLIQESSGLLLPGGVGERIVNHYTFYAAFADVEEFRIEANGRQLGTLPVEFLLQPGQRILFAGRTWIVNAVDIERRVIVVQPARGGAPPLFSGDGGRSHARVHQRMRELLSDTSTLPYLDAQAQEHLAQGRAAYVDMNLASAWLLRDGADATVLTWLGDDANEAIALLLSSRHWKVDRGGVGVSVQLGTRPIDELTVDVLAIANGTLEAVGEALLLAKNLEREKWDHLLDAELLARNFSSRFLDVQAARTWAGSLASML